MPSLYSYYKKLIVITFINRKALIRLFIILFYNITNIYIAY
jgi:hypothetical protein